MRILLLSGLLLALIASACTEKGSEPLVAPGTTIAPSGLVSSQPGIDAAGVVTSYPMEVSGDSEMALPKQRRPRPAKDELVIHNCLLVRDAAEAWAAESDGDYPGDPESRNTSGHTLIDFLPDGMHLVNPFDGTRNQPIYLAWGNPGDTDYLSFDDDRCNPSCDQNGYMITGFGESGEIYRITQNWPDSLVALDSLTIANCIAVRNAAEQFAAENNGEHPSDLSAITPLGHGLREFFPGEITYLRNPYTCQNTEPIDGQAVNQGETGYAVMMQGGVCTGYLITGYGRRDMLIEIVKDADAYKPNTTCKIRPRAL